MRLGMRRALGHPDSVRKLLLFAVASVWIGAQVKGQGYEYQIYFAPYKANGRVSQAAAREYCTEDFGGDLASITSQEEYNLIQRHVSSSYPGEGVWIGGMRIGAGSDDSNWRWVDDEPFVSTFSSGGNLFSAFGEGEPNNYQGKEDCLALDGETLAWNDVKCRLKRLGLCKRIARSASPTIPPPPTSRPTTAPSPALQPWDSWVRSEVSGRSCYYRYFNRVINKTLTDIDRRTWTGARDFCASTARDLTPEPESSDFTPYLADIKSEAENIFIRDLITVTYRDFPNRPVWLGGFDRHHEERFKWLDGEDVSYTNWAEGEPNNKVKEDEDEDCLQMNHARSYRPGFWNDANCDKKRGWICKVCI